jgi:hypothetical protein
LYEKSVTIFLVLLRYPHTGDTHIKTLFYDNKAKEFIDETLDIDIWAMYQYVDKELKTSKLKEYFLNDVDEIERINHSKDEKNVFKFTRLYHNGTSNAIETTILKVQRDKIDTLFFGKKWWTLARLGNYEWVSEDIIGNEKR